MQKKTAPSKKRVVIRKKVPTKKGESKEPPPQKNPRFDRPEPKVLFMRTKWYRLHLYAVKFPDAPHMRDVHAANRWLEKWAEDLPQDPPCARSWEDILRICPPPLKAGGRDFFWWTIAAHDRINVARGHAVWAARSKDHPLLLTEVHDPEGRLAPNAPLMNHQF